MKTEIELNQMILGITNKIRETDPELLKYLNEMPITIPDQQNPEITVKSLTSYYDSLVVLLNKYEENRPKNKAFENVQNLPIIEIQNMELNNSFQNLSIELNNFTVSYHDIGQSSVPIIFLHGFPFDKSMWDSQLDALKLSNRVIAIDIRGFGKSTDEKTHLNIALFADDLIMFMDKLEITKTIICGLSMGGFIALNALKRFPERFEALILCDTQCIADTAEVKEKRYKAIEQINLNGTTEFNEKFIKSVVHPKSLTDKKEVVENLRNVVFANSKQIIIAGIKALAEREESCSTLKSIQIPTLIICGREDEVTPLDQSEFMREHIDGSILKIIENSGHVSNLEHPNEFNKYLLDFVSSID